MIKPAEASVSSVQAEISSRISNNNSRDDTTKSAYMILSSNQDLDWSVVIEDIKNHLDKCTTRWVSGDDTVGRVEIPTAEEYAGLFGISILLSNRAGMREATNILEKERNQIVSLLALDGIHIQDEEDYSSSAAACALVVLYVGEQLEGGDVELNVGGSISPESTFKYWTLQLESQETIYGRAKKGIDRLDDIIKNPEHNRSIVEKMIDLAERADLNLSNLTTDRDLTPLIKYTQKLRR